MVVLTVYCIIISGIPFIKAAFTEKLTMDDLTLNYEKQNSREGFIVISLKREGRGEKAGIKVGDKVLAVDGKYLENSTDIKKILSSKKTGEIVNYLIKRDNSTFIAKVEVYKYFHLIFFIFYLLGMGFLINGFIVGYSRPKDISSIIFFLMGITASLGFNLYGGVVNYTGIHTFLWYNYTIGTIFFAPLFFHFFTLFPVKYVFRYRLFVLLFVYTYTILIYGGLSFLRGNENELILLITQILGYSPLIFLLFGILLFVNSFFQIKDSKLRKQLSIIFFGIISGFLGFFYYFFIFSYFISTNEMSILYRLPTLLVLAIPISFGYSIFKYKILDTEKIVKKSASVLIISTLIVISYFSFVFIFEQFLLDNLGTNRQIISIATVVIMIFIFDYFNKKLRVLIDKKLYSARYNYRKALSDFTEELPSIKNINDIFTKITSSIADTMNANYVKVWIFKSSYTSELLADIKNDKNIEYSDNYSDAVNEIFGKDFIPRLLYKPQLSGLNYSTYTFEIIRVNDVVLCIPVFFKQNLICAICLGHKPENTIYSEEDIDLLMTLSSQLSVALENSRLRIQELKNIKLQEELQIAKNIQMGLLPKTMNFSQRLDISGITIPAMEIGGDFFDIIKVTENKIFVIVADVSGKGIPAAIYMSKIQAMTQLASRMYNSPREILIELNRKIYPKLGRDTFVTMVLGLFELDKNTVRIARAGHNPVILSCNGKIEMLNSKGIGLGLDSDIIFKNTLEEITLPLEKNKVFLFYTDGINEAMNKNKDEFSIERIKVIIEENIGKSSNEMQDSLLKAVHSFKGNYIQNDDITSLIIKVLN